MQNRQMSKASKYMALVIAAILTVQLFCGCGALDRFTKTRVQWRDEAVGRAAAVSLGKRENAAVYFDELDQIRELILVSDKPVDLTDVSGLTGLERVDLSGVQVLDYAPLLFCENLSYVRVGENVDYEANIEALEQLQETVSDHDIDVDANYWSHMTATFEDPVIEQAVREALQMPEGQMTFADTRKIDVLTLNDASLTHVQDLENLVRLRELTMQRCNLTDFAPFTTLSSLMYLNLEENEISDLSGIEMLTRLQVLSISHNPVADISMLPQLPHLFALSAAGCPISDFTPLASIEKLSNLSLSECGLEKIDFLRDCGELSVLWLDENEISDLSALSQLSNLTVLGLTSNRITDITPLSKLTNLTNLYLANNNVSDISALAQLSALQSLQLTMNNVYDVSVLAQLPVLDELGILSNPVTDFTPLAQLSRQWKQIDVDLTLAKQATDTAAQIAADIAAQGLTGADAVRAAHDAVINRTRYDHNAAASGELGFVVQSTYAALVRGSAVCVGYAEAVAVICRLLGIEAYVVSGTAGGVEHAWTMCVLDGTVYYVDATWDDPDEGNLIYRDYLLVDEAVMRQNHAWDVALFMPNAA